MSAPEWMQQAVAASRSREPVLDNLKAMFTLTLGQRVLVRDASDKIHGAEVGRVPAEWRDGSGHVTTGKGLFPKVWVHVDGYTGAIPWPLDAVVPDPPREGQ